MRILAIDIGAGTQDILLFDSGKNIENCTSLVLPAPSRIFAKRLRDLTGDIYVRGDTIGGGSLTQSILQHLKRGHRVVMQESAAYSLRNDLDEVRSMGVEVGKRPAGDSFQVFEIREIDLPLLQDFLSHFGEDPSLDVVAIAVQDHGVSPKGVSDRIFRFEKMEAMLQKENRPESFHFLGDEVPEYCLRMKSAVRAVRRSSIVPVLIMDTAFSAILGCLDESPEPSLIVNVGNGHTLAAFLVGKKIEGLYEHHTHELTPKKLEEELRLFVRGELRSEQVYEENGHGVINLKPFHEEVSVIVTGPNRDLLKGASMKVTYAAPGGSMMMTGPMGLVKATLSRFKRS